MTDNKKRIENLIEQINLNTDRHNKINQLLDESRKFTIQLQLDLLRALRKERDMENGTCVPEEQLREKELAIKKANENEVIGGLSQLISKIL